MPARLALRHIKPDWSHPVKAWELTMNQFAMLYEEFYAEVLKLIIERLFILALIAMVLGFVAYIVVKVVP
jgi:hypothetical protein